MNCHELPLLLHAYADGELDLPHSLEVEQHLKTCPACTATERSVQSLSAALRQSDLAYAAPPALRRSVRAAVGVPERSPAGRELALNFWRWLAMGTTAFAALLLVLRPGSLGESGQIADEAISDHVRSLMAGHLTDVASTDQHTVKPWFNGKIDFAPNVKDFAEQGFPLIGGRLDYLDGRTVAALVYRRNQHFINVFVWPIQNSTGEKAESQRGYSTVQRDATGLRYYFVSDLNQEELKQFARLLAE